MFSLQSPAALMRGKLVLAKHGQIYEPAGLPGTALTTDINITALRGGCVTWGSRDVNPNTVESLRRSIRRRAHKRCDCTLAWPLVVGAASPSRCETSRDTITTVVTTRKLVNN